MLAEVTAREVGGIDLREALELTALIAQKDRARAERYASRWLRRYADERNPDIREVALASATLDALGGPLHAEALALLRAAAGS